jgi:hypothetical protein
MYFLSYQKERLPVRMALYQRSGETAKVNFLKGISHL